MKTRLIIAAAMALVLGLSSLALAGSTATQSVTYEVQEINEISVSGDPGSLIINTATAGSEPNDATDKSTTYAITTNGSNKKITGAIDTDIYPALATGQPCCTYRRHFCGGRCTH